MQGSEKDGNPFLEQIWKQRDMFPVQSPWLIGGDGWAYDIGQAGLDHVLSRGENLNILVLDTEMYSNTGGQISKVCATYVFVTQFQKMGAYGLPLGLHEQFQCLLQLIGHL